MSDHPHIKKLGDHPRTKESGFIECSNCGHEVAPNASMCPECDYPWPLAQDKNRMTCTTCKKLICVYVKRKYARYNQWDKTSMCYYCGAPIRWNQVNVEADTKPWYESYSGPDWLLLFFVIVMGLFFLGMMIGKYFGPASPFG
ncbi:hypothetical protein DRQ25_17775 [Candidatus Fermentibacteria bacterium]|nr:MAG: hypothetical protein DRQ25_17775 [Candidatus Fermentibacteria bacterium]